MTEAVPGISERWEPFDMVMEMNEQARKVVIIGSGPAGLTAAVYAARANLNPLVIEGIQAGGQLMLTTDVENYPGFVDGIMGPDLMGNMRKQAARFEADFVTENVTQVDLSQRPFVIRTRDELVEAEAVIVSTGASARMLGVPGESKLLGHGVSTCATCDGFFFRGKELLIVGGGDSAMEEAIFLTKFASRVRVVHRRDGLRASKIMQDRAFDNPKIEFVWDSEVTEILGDDSVSGARIRNVKSGEDSELDAGGVFVAIGHTPNTSLFEDQLELDGGYIKVSGETTQTSVPGVFAAGDVVDFRYRQAITAAGMGCMAAIDAERYVEGAPITEHAW
ncbi:thioredoxin-disulfide reductase [soil metagenome]